MSDLSSQMVNKEKISKRRIAFESLCANGTRPFPERLEALYPFSSGPAKRDVIDLAFAHAEQVSLPKNPCHANFDRNRPRLSADEVVAQLSEVTQNRKWLQESLAKIACRYRLTLSNDTVAAATFLLDFLSHNISYWEADSLPLDLMMELPNRYAWTFSFDVWSLGEQLKQEAEVVRSALNILERMAQESPLLVILNERTPTDYMTSVLPPYAAIYDDQKSLFTAPVLFFTGLKISSSEHKCPLQNSNEGNHLKNAAKIAAKLGRRIVLCDFSRRRFPRSFLRVVRFARQEGWGIDPVGKLLDPFARHIPKPKSPNGFCAFNGRPILTLLDPWPISDTQVLEGVPIEIVNQYGRGIHTKPWQDDRIGARREMEMDEDGHYRMGPPSWIVPVLGGWMRVSEVFKSRLARFLLKGDACP